MDATTVYAKTALGQEEIATRARNVSARLRAMLIMVDGRRSVGDLLAFHPAPDEARGYLESLASGGLIAALGDAAPSSAAAAPATGHSEPAVSPAVQPVADLASAKRAVVQMLVDFLGPDGDMFCERVERVKDREQFIEECQRLASMLESAVGRERAQRFRDTLAPLVG